MENNKKENGILEKEQLLILNSRKNLSITSVLKVVSLKPDLIQLHTNFGGMLILGQNLELIKLDNNTTRIEIFGEINEIKYCETKQKNNLFRKIFKWYFYQPINFLLVFTS